RQGWPRRRRNPERGLDRRQRVEVGPLEVFLLAVLAVLVGRRSGLRGDITDLETTRQGERLIGLRRAQAGWHGTLTHVRVAAAWHLRAHLHRLLLVVTRSHVLPQPAEVVAVSGRPIAGAGHLLP